MQGGPGRDGRRNCRPPEPKFTTFFMPVSWTGIEIRLGIRLRVGNRGRSGHRRDSLLAALDVDMNPLVIAVRSANWLIISCVTTSSSPRSPYSSEAWALMASMSSKAMAVMGGSVRPGPTARTLTVNGRLTSGAWEHLR